MHKLTTTFFFSFTCYLGHYTVVVVFKIICVYKLDDMCGIAYSQVPKTLLGRYEESAFVTTRTLEDAEATANSKTVRTSAGSKAVAPNWGGRHCTLYCTLSMQRQKMPASFKGVLGETVKMINFMEPQPSRAQLLVFRVMRSAVCLEYWGRSTRTAVGKCTCEVM